MERLVIAHFSPNPKIKAMAVGLAALCPLDCSVLDLMGHEVPRFDKDTLVLPLLVQKGGLWKALCNSGAKVAPPLLDSDKDLALIVSGIQLALPRMEGRSYLLVGHGDEGGEIKEHRKLQALLRKDVHFITLKSMDKLSGLSPTVVIIPFLLSYGHHARVELKGELVPRLEKMGLTAVLVEAGLVDYIPEVEEIFTRHLFDLMKRRRP